MAPSRQFRWVRPDVYPVLGAVGLGIAASAVIMSRKLFADPGVNWNKFKRGEDIDMEKAARYRDNWHRRLFAGRVVGILPDPIRRNLPDSLQDAAKDAERVDAHAKA